LLRGSGATDPMNLNWVMPAKGSGTQGTLMMAAPPLQGSGHFCCEVIVSMILGRLEPPILCLVTDQASCAGRPLESVVHQAVEAGVNLVQLRQKELPAGELLELGRRLMPGVRDRGVALVVNDRLDVAMALEADGVQLGGGCLPVGTVRRLVGGGMLVGASVHSREGAMRAEGEGADYLVLGTIFETASHPGRAPSGVELVAAVVSAVRVPVLAIGGINAANARSVMAAGAAGVAVIRAIQSAEDVAGATRELLRAMGAPGHGTTKARRHEGDRGTG
jgi:thiamine-phosphate pyrophosphorylase